VVGLGGTGVAWLVDGVPGGAGPKGTIDATGRYTAPALVPPGGPVLVTAVSTTDPTKSATASVTVTTNPPVLVSIRFRNSGVLVGAHLDLGIAVANAADAAATIYVDGVSGGSPVTGTISPTGIFQAPAEVPSPATVRITATSNADPSKSDTTTVTILPFPPPLLYLANWAGQPMEPCFETTMPPGETMLYYPTVTNSLDNTIVYSVSGVTGGSQVLGTITGSRTYLVTYQAPATPPPGGLVYITARLPGSPSAETVTRIRIQ